MVVGNINDTQATRVCGQPVHSTSFPDIVLSLIYVGPVKYAKLQDRLQRLTIPTLCSAEQVDDLADCLILRAVVEGKVQAWGLSPNLLRGYAITKAICSDVFNNH